MLRGDGVHAREAGPERRRVGASDLRVRRMRPQSNVQRERRRQLMGDLKKNLAAKPYVAPALAMKAMYFLLAGAAIHLRRDDCADGTTSSKQLTK
jgi:hypothetical protein